MPQIGDLIVQDEKHYGLVRDIVLDTWGHQRSVFIEWSDNNQPHDYNTKHGHAGVNIHNLRSKFRVIREGEEIL